MACILLAIVDVYLADFAESSEGTRTGEIVDQIMTGSSILARVWQTVVDVEFAVLTLKTFSALTLVSPNKIFAYCAVLARGGITFVDFFLAVRASVSF